jgi:hypothetical protein
MSNRLTATDAERFAQKYQVDYSGCWTWTAANTGQIVLSYGRFYDRATRRVVMAHRWSYERTVGPIPGGLELDHLCRNTLCVNPAHLEPVTRRENVVRGTSPNAINAAKTHCRRGHELTQENCYAFRWPKTRQCKLCARINEQEKRDRRKVEAVA